MEMGMGLPRVCAWLCGAAGCLGDDGWDVARQPMKTSVFMAVGMDGVDGTRPSDDEDFVVN